MIVRNAHLVNTGMPPKLKNAAANDFFFLPRRDSVRLVETVVELCKTRLPDKMGIPADELQVLTPTRRGDAGTRSLNFALQAALNPPKPGKQERRFGELIFREGDRVMQTRNDYDVVWQKEDGTAGTGIFNGDVGKIAKIDPSGELLEIVFDDRTATYTSDMLAELDMAYAMTVHKAQGSEYRGVVFVGAPCAPSLMCAACSIPPSPARESCSSSVGDDSAVNKMAENDRRSRRYSGLKWRLRKGGEEKSFLESLASLLFPPRCAFCGKPGVHGVCSECEKALPYCKTPLHERAEIGACLAPLKYEGIVREALLSYKFHAGQSRCTGFGDVLAQGRRRALWRGVRLSYLRPRVEKTQTRARLRPVVSLGARDLPPLERRAGNAAAKDEGERRAVVAFVP